jgi:all-trans-retinol 13,14-reductase
MAYSVYAFSAGIPMPDKAQTYDVIIIGSGISGLTSASLFASLYKKKVLVLEQHGKIGGFTHTFKRLAKYEWDIGLHYVGEMQQGEMTRAVFDLITRGQVSWKKMPDPYDIFVYPDSTFPLREGEENFKQDLIRLFPKEEKSIRRYFSDLHGALGWSGRYQLSLLLPRWLKFMAALLLLPGKRRATALSGDYLDRHFKDERLKAILVSQWGNYGLPPGQSAFVLHAMIVMHYINGAFYPVGGAKKIADSIIPVVEESGGALLVRHRVTEIIIDGNRAVGVKCLESQATGVKEKEFYAKTVISAAGAFTTYTNLLPPDLAAPVLHKLEKFSPGLSNVSVFIGLKKDPALLGWKGENYWIFAGYNHDSLFARRNKLLDGIVSAVYVSFPSKKNPLAQSHTMAILAFVDYQPFAPWAGQQVKKRDEDYRQLKEKIAGAIIQFVENHFPGFSELIDYVELGTPLTNQHYTAHPAGNIYGIPGRPERYLPDVISYRTPLKNLYLTGADTAGHGIVGAMMSGLLITALITGLPWQLFRIFSAAKKYHNHLKPSDAR